ncbi:MAG: hypothetical protein GZ086_00900 [Gelidibacter sp.]|nr:hypothetical protein [Gelidibacter sp.]
MATDLFSQLISIVYGIHKDLKTNNQYQQEIQNLSYNIKYEKNPIYKVDFKYPVAIKEKYYFKLIEKESQIIYNEMICEFHPQATLPELQFTYSIFYNRIEQYLLQINNYLSDRELNSTDSKIINFLRVNAIFLFMELQDKFIKYASKDYVSLEEVYEHYFGINSSEISELIPSELFDNIDFTISPETKEKDKIFKAILGELEFRATKKNVLLYDAIILKKERFAEAEELLFEEEIINEDYNFISNRKRNNKSQMAAFYHTIIEKGYFNDKVFEPYKKIDHKEYVRFLNHRYDINTSKVFNNFKNNAEKLNEITLLNTWFKNIRK